ncbi:MAG: hypothetical protein ACT6RL_00570 [Neoaquamicrobium sediminum]|uniref:hypothetical protein n=1 Tax=Neoaquamicrobium sediminum TaxID=1849104 RepID=UPI00403659B3
MSIIHKQLRALALSTLFGGLAVTGASAQAVEEALGRLKALSADQGVTLDWASADISGDDAVLSGVTVTVDGKSTPISDITLSGISEVDSGYRIERLEADDYSMSNDGGSVAVEGVEMTGLLLPSEEDRDAYGGFLFYETIAVASMSVAAQGNEIFSLTDLQAEVTAGEAGEPMSFTGGADGFTVNLSFLEPQQRAIMQALGYEELQGYLEMEGSWQPTDGRIELSQYDVTVDGAGTFGLSFDLAGYTPDFIASLRELQQQALANPDGDKSAQGMAMLGLAQQLSFNRAEIAFDDDSLTGKVLDFVAAQQNMSASDVANQAKAILPFVLAQLGDPDLTAKITQAVSAFLDDPQSLRITAAPPAPVPFALIAAGAMSAPKELTKTLGVTVTAND